MNDPNNPLPSNLDRRVPANFDRFSTETIAVIRAVTEVAKTVFGKEYVKELQGSVSVSIDGKVIAKILPQEPGSREYVLAGVSSDYSPRSWPGITLPFEDESVVHNSPFHFYRLPHAQPASASEAAGSLFRQLKARLAAS